MRRFLRPLLACLLLAALHGLFTLQAASNHATADSGRELTVSSRRTFRSLPDGAGGRRVKGLPPIVQAPAPIPSEDSSTAPLPAPRIDDHTTAIAVPDSTLPEDVLRLWGRRPAAPLDPSLYEFSPDLGLERRPPTKRSSKAPVDVDVAVIVPTLPRVMRPTSQAHLPGYYAYLGLLTGFVIETMP